MENISSLKKIKMRHYDKKNWLLMSKNDLQ